METTELIKRLNEINDILAKHKISGVAKYQINKLIRDVKISHFVDKSKKRFKIKSKY